MPTNRSALRMVAANFGWQFAGEAAGKALAFASAVYLARVLGAEGFGLFSYAWVLITYGMLATDLGMNNMGVRDLARDRTVLSGLVANITAIKMLAATVVFAAASGLAWSFAENPETAVLITLTFIWLFPHSISVEWVFRGLEKMGYSAAWNVVHQVVFILLLIGLVKGREDLLAVPLYKAAGAVAGSLLLWAFLFGKTRCPGLGQLVSLVEPSRWRGILGVSVPIGGSYAMVLIITNFDVMFLGMVDEPKTVGWYSAAYSVVILFSVFSHLIGSSFFPRISSSFASDRDAFLRLLKVLIAVSLAAGTLSAVGVFSLSGVVLPVLLGPEYIPSVKPLMMLSPVILMIFAAVPFGTTFVATGLERPAFLIITAGAVINVCMNLVLIPRYSMTGAAIATNLSYIAIIALDVVVFRRAVLAMPAGRKD